MALPSVGLVNPGSFCWGHCLPEGQDPLRGAGTVCCPSCKELPGADQRDPLRSQTPTARAPLRQPRSSTALRARAVVSSSSRSHLLQRKTEQKSTDDSHQANPLRPSRGCPPSAVCKGETSGPRGLCSLLLQQRDGTDVPCRKGSSSPSAAEVPACKRGKGLSSQNLLTKWPTPPSWPDGTSGGHCLGPACKKHAVLAEQPRSRKGHQQAASATWQPVRGKDGQDWQPGMCPVAQDVPSRPRLPSMSMFLLH